MKVILQIQVQHERQQVDTDVAEYISAEVSAMQHRSATAGRDGGRAPGPALLPAAARRRA